MKIEFITIHALREINGNFYHLSTVVESTTNTENVYDKYCNFHDCDENHFLQIILLTNFQVSILWHLTDDNVA